LEESPTTIADATSTPAAACGINVAGAPVVGQIDNERLSSSTYATATRESDNATGERLLAPPAAVVWIDLEQPDRALGPSGAEGAAIIESRSPAAVGAAGGERRRGCGGTGFGSRPSLRRHTKAAESRHTEADEERTSVNGS
jgi:hypothetical protein